VTPPPAPAGVSDAGLQSIAALSGLTHLNLDSRHVTDEGLAHLTSLVKLRALDLFGAKISDAGCAHLRLAASRHTGLCLSMVQMENLRHCLLDAKLGTACARALAPLNALLCGRTMHFWLSAAVSRLPRCTPCRLSS